MANKQLQTGIVGVVIDEYSVFNLKELCDFCGAHAEQVIEMVEYGILEPYGDSPANWQFSGDSLIRSKKAFNLLYDLNINVAGVALILDLLQEIEQLRLRLNTLEQQLKLLGF